jgi:hypothetical protein
MGNDQPALHALFACESGLSDLIWQKKRDKIRTRCPVWKNNCKLLSVTFI